MVYLSKENPIIATTTERSFQKGDAISYNGELFEIVSISDTGYTLRNLKVSRITKTVPFLEMIELPKSKYDKTNHLFAYEKVATILNSRWKGEMK